MTAQVPLAQVGVSPEVEQTTPHPPQLASVLSGVSQPGAALQSPKPGRHTLIHMPVPQVALALGKGPQLMPQPPQSESVVSAVSQPSVALALQLPQPTSQLASAQVPPAQVSEARGSSQVTPQPPQSVSVLSEVSHPSAVTPLQLAKPASHAVMRHAPVAQLETACESAHATPQAPQLVVVSSAVSQPSP